MTTTFDYAATRALTDSEVLVTLQRTFPKLGLYSISLGWREDRAFILKARGRGGDVLVTWEVAS